MGQKTIKTLLRYVIVVIRYRCQRQSARKSEKLKPQGGRCGVTGLNGHVYCAWGGGDRLNEPLCDHVLNDDAPLGWLGPRNEWRI